MIHNAVVEELSSIREKSIGVKNVSLVHLMDRADEMETHWVDRITEKKGSVPPVSLVIDMPNGINGTIKPSLSAQYYDEAGNQKITDMTQYAFGQLCQKVGVPPSYMMKCLDAEKPELALYNFDQWAKSQNFMDSNIRVREYDDTARAFLTDNWNPRAISEVLHATNDAMTNYGGNYEANQSFLSPDKLHVRFVDFNNPIRIGQDTLHPGFTISTSDVGAGSLNIKYFLYRFVCKNGMVIIQHGGMLFRQSHLAINNNITSDIFIKALDTINKLNEYAKKKIDVAYNKKLDSFELEAYINRAKKELHLGKKGDEKLIELVKTKYYPTAWGVLNAVTENAQRFTLEDRIVHETWAGGMLDKIAA